MIARHTALDTDGADLSIISFEMLGRYHLTGLLGLTSDD